MCICIYAVTITALVENQMEMKFLHIYVTPNVDPLRIHVWMMSTCFVDVFCIVVFVFTGFFMVQ